MSFLLEYHWFLFCIPVVAFLYASVGHGGASGYIALMILFGFAESDIKPIALVMNVFVSAIAFYHYQRQGFFKANLFLYFAIGSIPLSFLGGYLQVSPFVYNSILILFLIFSILKLSDLLKFRFTRTQLRFNAVSAISIGGLIGFSSGLIGIGGGIILTPIILILNWGSMKEAAAVSALFIWVNSISGLLGQVFHGVSVPSITWSLVIFAVLGGYLGSYIGAKKLDRRVVKILLLIVLGIACVKLIFSLWKMM